MKTYTSKELRSMSRDCYHNNGYIAYILFFFSLVVVAGIIAINLFLPALVYVLIPLIVIPLFFASEISIILLRRDGTITFGGFFRGFIGYFSDHFRSTYGVIKSGLFALAFFGGTLIVTAVTVSTAFTLTNYLGFSDFLFGLLKLSSVEVINTYLQEHAELINLFMMYTVYPAITMFFFVFMYLTSREAGSIFYRANKSMLPGKLLQYLHRSFLKNNKALFRSYHWSLNYPFFILLAIGYGLGSYFGFLFDYSYNAMLTFGIITSLFIAFVIYGPRYLANKESIYEAIKEKYALEEENMKAQYHDAISELQQRMEEMQNKNDNIDEE